MKAMQYTVEIAAGGLVSDSFGSCLRSWIRIEVLFFYSSAELSDAQHYNL